MKAFRNKTINWKHSNIRKEKKGPLMMKSYFCSLVKPNNNLHSGATLLSDASRFQVFHKKTFAQTFFRVVSEFQGRLGKSHTSLLCDCCWAASVFAVDHLP